MYFQKWQQEQLFDLFTDLHMYLKRQSFSSIFGQLNTCTNTWSNYQKIQHRRNHLHILGTVMLGKKEDMKRKKKKKKEEKYAYCHLLGEIQNSHLVRIP